MSRCGPASGPYGELGARAAVARLPSPSLGPVPAASLTSPYYAFMDRAHGAAPRSSVVSLPCSTSGILAAWWPAGPGQVKQPAMQASPCLRLRRRRRQSVRHLPHLATSRGFVRWHIAAVDAAHPPTRVQGCPVGSGEQTAHGQRSFGAGPPVHGSMSTPCARRGNISTNHGLGRLTAAPSARIRPRACEKRAARCRASSSFTRRDETEHLDPTIPSAATGTWLAQRAFPVPAVL